MTDTSKLNDEITESQQNANKIRCQFCNSLILTPNNAKFIEKEFSLPLMHQKHSRNLDELETEVFKDFWVVDDMFTFENIGFSNTVGDYKYLICADCDMGPVGYHILSTKKNYIALVRVKHEK
ncbi:CLUMA_CG014199, isoform A [Clunio marinus]|uniref:CLUMA_CG014199, isoform A n=1 Tax=Clunio marinus TaxID=568069 RepID=A0A1J1IPT2_9DIPT|nr:CLUMA_CG014199, isoform A [Clunio marinus]